MKRIILIAAILTAGLICNAQYNYYNPYIDAAIASVIISETDEMYKLDNIRFDENAIRQNPDAWANYMNYLEFDADYNKKIKTYGTIAWVGLGVAFTSLIPLCMDLGYDYDDPRSDLAIDWGISLLCVGGVASLVGLLGWAVQLDKIKINKKEFIYYLKTTNNGVGIVTIF